MSAIAENIRAIRATIPENVTLIGVTKYHSLEETQEVVDAGVYDLGENRVQEFLEKEGRINGPVRWHFIGHLQTNKVKYLIGKVTLIHSVHSIKLLKTIEKESIKQGLVTDVLLQFNLAKEATKSGFMAEEYQEVMDFCRQLTHVRVMGLMCMGPMTKNSEAIRKIFKQLKEIYDTIKKDYCNEAPITMRYLSMGMTDDYPIAIEEGATMVRIGRKIFSR